MFLIRLISALFALLKINEGINMKISSTITIAALFMLSACASENNGNSQASQHIDEWSPFVQVAPPRDIWETQTFEAVYCPCASTPNTPNYAIDYYMLTPEERIFRWREYEIQRAFNFFFPDELHFFTSTAQTYPDFFGGFELSRRIARVMIVENRENEAQEFLAYLERFKTIEIYFVPRSFNDLIAVHRLIISANIYPRRWHVIRNHMEGYVQIELFDYSEEEKAFFREHVLDSPLVQFRRSERT